MEINIYGHSGSFNHGNEAIVRGVVNLFYNKRIKLYSFSPRIDIKFNLDEVCRVCPFYDKINKYSLFNIILRIYGKFLAKDIYKLKRFLHKNFFNEINGIYLLEAGDQYCENKTLREYYAFLNKNINKRGGKTIMLGCTINEDILNDNNVINDLNNYSIIIARESLTYNALKKRNIKTKIFMAPDPAFIMNAREIDISDIFEKDVVAINCGFLAQGNHIFYEKMMKNCFELIKYILKSTNFHVLLVPHVNWSYKLSDLKSLEILFYSFYSYYPGRVRILEERRADEIKYIISKCKFLISLRTHLAISGISSLVPTLVTGYKTKSTGIVRDIFGDDTFLADVSLLTNDFFYKTKFENILKNEDNLRKKIEEIVPKYIKETWNIKEIITKEFENII